jgi:two-component system, NarL family, response regulator DevR
MTLRVMTPVERPSRVVLAANHDVLRLGLRVLLEASGRLEVVADVSTVPEATVAAAEHRRALVLIAGPLADETGIDACREILRHVHDARVVIIGEYPDAAFALAATRAGAVGCLSRRAGAQHLCRALRELVTGERTSLAPVEWMRRPGRARTVRDVLALTVQERRVLGLVAGGKTNKEIGTTLGLSAKTVKNYLSHAFEKLNVSRRAHAAVLFVKDHGAGLTTGRSV